MLVNGAVTVSQKIELSEDEIKEKRREYQRKWYLAHKEEVKIYSEKYDY